METLFNNLMSLCDNADKAKFFYKDFVSPFETVFRIFSYNYASYSDWILPDALECRGIMFEMKDGKPVRIAARPMEKFFNLGETPFTMNLDLTKTALILAKEDGSLISTFIDNDTLCIKSKGSIYSQQASEALSVLLRAENDALKQRIKELARDGYTCNFEYVSPTNRIVLEYQEKHLVLLNVRENETGKYIPYSELFKDGILRRYLVAGYEFDTTSKTLVEDIQKQEGIEGFIFELEDGLKFKLKTTWYCALHHTKDSINNNQRLFEAIVAGASDDLKGMFVGDVYAVSKVEAFEAAHLEYLRKSIATIESVYTELRGKERKDFAVQAQAKLPQELFGVIMQTYASGINYDTIVSQINKVFMKNFKAYVPSDYIVEKIIFTE